MHHHKVSKSNNRVCVCPLRDDQPLAHSVLSFKFLLVLVRTRTYLCWYSCNYRLSGNFYKLSARLSQQCSVGLCLVHVSTSINVSVLSDKHECCVLINLTSPSPRACLGSSWHCSNGCDGRLDVVSASRQRYLWAVKQLLNSLTVVHTSGHHLIIIKKPTCIEYVLPESGDDHVV